MNRNGFLKSYLKEFNAQLISLHQYLRNNPILILLINHSCYFYRIVDQGNCIKYKKKYYMGYNNNHLKVPLKPKMEVLVIESFDQKLYVNAVDNLYALEEIPLHEKLSKEFDSDSDTPKQKKVYIPPLNHPWRVYSYQLFTKK